MTDWLTVDRKGLAKVVLRRGYAFILYELIQNCWDTNATFVDVKVKPVAGKPLVEITVEDDDPDGFRDLTHAYTLYAESEKKGDPTKRGFMNLGEKLVLAICEEAEIRSTTGVIFFDKERGRRSSNLPNTRRDKGTVFKAILRMTREQMNEMLTAAFWLIPAIPTTINGQRLMEIPVKRSFEVTLPTMIADEEGVMKPTRRKTKVEVMGLGSEGGRIYELGIPVCETGDPWCVNICQKVPLNADRDNVTPAFLREVRVAVVNAMKDEIKPEAAASPAAASALANPAITPEAVKAIITAKYGERVMVADIKDQQANHAAMAAGEVVIPGSAFSKDQWEQIRAAGAVPVTTTKYATGSESGGSTMFEDKLTAGMKKIRWLAKVLAKRLIGYDIEVYFEDSKNTSRLACYGNRTLTFNVGTLGEWWFDRSPRNEEILDLLLHEFGHEYESNHLSSAYYAALTKLGARLTGIALNEPDLFSGVDR